MRTPSSGARCGARCRSSRWAASASRPCWRLVSHGLFSSYELVGRHETGHKVSVPRTLGIGAVCYAFNLNFGALVGALAIKLRLYDRAGLKAKQVARIIVLSIVTNWIGYLFVGGLVMLLSPPPMPQRIDLSDGALRAIGGGNDRGVAGLCAGLRAAPRQGNIGARASVCAADTARRALAAGGGRCQLGADGRDRVGVARTVGAVCAPWSVSCCSPQWPAW